MNVTLLSVSSRDTPALIRPASQEECVVVSSAYMSELDWKTLPSLSALRAFDAAARHDSFSAAARSLNVTHAAIAQQVRALEKDLGLALVVRAPGGIGLTEAGRRLAEATSAGFGRIATAVDLARRSTGDSLRVTTTTFITDAVILPAIGEFWRQHPDIEIAFAPTVRVVDIEAEGFDVAVRSTIGPMPDDPLAIPLMVSPFVAVAAPSLAAHVTDWRRVDWLGLNTPWEREVLDEAGLSGVRMREVGAPGLELQATLRGIGAAYGSEIVYRAALRDGSVVRIPVEIRRQSSYYALVRSGPRSRALSLFLDWLVAVFEEARRTDAIPNLFRRPFRQDPLQGAPVHVQPAGGLGNVAVAEFINPLDVLPSNPVGTHRVLGRRRKAVAPRKQRRCHIVRVGGFREIVRSPDLHRGNSGRDGAITCQDDDPSVLPALANALHDVQPVAVLQTQVHHCKGRRTRRGDGRSGRHGLGRLDLEAPLLHRPRQPLQERLVIVDDQQGLVGTDVLELAHVSPSPLGRATVGCPLHTVKPVAPD